MLEKNQNKSPNCLKSKKRILTQGKQKEGTNKAKAWAGRVAQVLEYLHTKFKALSSNLITKNTQKSVKQILGSLKNI
jgi:hypothetical protein